MRYMQAVQLDEINDAFEQPSLSDLFRLATEYMRQAPVVLRAAGTFTHPALPDEQPIGQASDGEWVWPLVAPNLLSAGVMSPEPDFLRHVSAAGRPPVSLDPDTLREAVEVARRGHS